MYRLYERLGFEEGVQNGNEYTAMLEESGRLHLGSEKKIIQHLCGSFGLGDMGSVKIRNKGTAMWREEKNHFYKLSIIVLD